MRKKRGGEKLREGERKKIERRKEWNCAREREKLWEGEREREIKRGNERNWEKEGEKLKDEEKLEKWRWREFKWKGWRGIDRLERKKRGGNGLRGREQWREMGKLRQMNWERRWEAREMKLRMIGRVRKGDGNGKSLEKACNFTKNKIFFLFQNLWFHLLDKERDICLAFVEKGHLS